MSSSTSFVHEDSVRGQELHDFAALRYLLSFARSERRGFALGFGLLIGAAVSSAFAARLLGRLVDEGILTGDSGAAFRLAATGVGLQVAALLLIFLGRSVIVRASLASLYHIRTTLFRHLGALSISFYDRNPQGRTVTRLTHDVEGLENFFSTTMGRLLGSFIMAAGALGAMLVSDLRLGLLAGLAGVPAVLVTLLTRHQNRELNRQSSREGSAVNARMAEYLSGMPVIRGFGLEEWSRERVDELVRRLVRTSIDLNRLAAWQRPVIGYLSMLPLMVVIWFAGNRVLSGALGLGLFVSFIRYLEQLGRPMMELTFEIHVVQEAFASAERLATLLRGQVEEEVLGPSGVLTPSHLLGEIQFSGVGMSYLPGVTTLADLSFYASPGTKVGLTGATGSGKTTMISLLARIYPFQSGEIRIDGELIENYDRAALRRNIGVVAQDVVIFRGTMRENLLLNEQLSDDGILSCCNETGLSEVMYRKEMTLDSQLLERGSNFSVGERQLIALTRILIKNPSILILDEATANVDQAAEERIHKAIDRVMEGRTCFIIAHRLDTLSACDLLLVFEQGHLVEKGAPDELLARKEGHFSKLWSLR